MKTFLEFIAEDRLSNDILSLKRIGWSLDKVTKHLITKTDDYGKLTSDQIAGIYSPVKAKKAPAPRVYTPKPPKWPADPPASKINDASHAEAWLAKAIASEESPDIEGSEAYTLMSTAGYTDKAAFAVTKNMFGYDEAEHKRGHKDRKFDKYTSDLRKGKFKNK